MNPSDGSLEYIGELKNGKQTFFHSSGYRAGNDKVLIITDATTSYLSKDQKNIL